MVNLTFYSLDVPYPIITGNSEAQHSSISIYISLQRDDHSCWNFVIDFLRTSDRCFPNFHWFLGHLLFGFLIPGEIIVFTDPEGRSVGFSKTMEHDPICWMLWYHVGFFQTTAGVCSDRGRFVFELFGSF